MVRKEGRKSIKTIWIFCEGEKTEIYYFQRLKAKERILFNVKINTSEQKNAIGLVNHICRYKQTHTRDFLKEDIIYCIFDRDANSNDEFSHAEKIAKENGIEIIFSNPSFEYWILSHFGYYSNRFEKENLTAKLEKQISGYKKNDKDIYDKTESKIKEAIINAKRINKTHDKILCRESNPSTQIFRVIEKFKELKR
ncbi:MAG: RloB family protein [archaeon]